MTKKDEVAITWWLLPTVEELRMLHTSLTKKRTNIMKLNLMLLALLSSSAAIAETNVFPDPSDSWRETPQVMDIAKVQLLALGMTKGQIYRLLGTPHFDEGLGADKWNYWFVNSAQQTCQLRIDFDHKARLSGTDWAGAGCM
jgi:outer membrane protein assembly factor BamE (lipoprotein component of BamABCDE complex)